MEEETTAHIEQMEKNQQETVGVSRTNDPNDASDNETISRERGS